MEELIQRIRDHYVEQFKAFVAWQRQALGSGVGEVMFRIDESEELFKKLYRVDFLANSGDEVTVREMQPDRVLTFDQVTGSIGSAGVEIFDLRWDDVIVAHDLQADVDGLDYWFDAWFDPEDERYDPDAELSGCIHSLSVDQGKVFVDFGTAPPDAFWHLMKVLLDAGVKQIRISCTEGR